jgi:hypothetical protein
MNGRMYDAVLGRFLSPDNYVQDPYNTQSFNRYGYVWNNPLSYNDPSGEFLVSALIGAAIGVLTNGINNVVNDRPFFRGAGKAALFGFMGGAVSFGIGHVAGMISNTYLSVAYQVGMHGLTGGMFSGAQGGSFGSGFLSGALSSGISSAVSSVKIDSNFWSASVQVVSGGVAGGFGSQIAGGNFMDGLRQGIITSSLNHVAHKLQQKDPLKKFKDQAISLDEWIEIYGDKAWSEIATESGWKQGQPLGPKHRYVVNPQDGNIMDMRHVSIVGYGYGETIGDAVEHVQNALPSTRASAFDPQDYYSNKIGAYFYQLRHTGSWASKSWAYDFGRFIDTQYRSLSKFIIPK